MSQAQAQAQAVVIEPIDDHICGYFNALSEQDKQRFRAILNNPRYQNTNGQFDFFSVLRWLDREARHFNQTNGLTNGADEIVRKLQESVLPWKIEQHKTTIRKYNENRVIIIDYNFIIDHLENFRNTEPLILDYDSHTTERFFSTIQNICMNTLTDTVADNVVIPTATAVGGRRKSRRTKKRKSKRRKSKRTRK
jgi:hypothetical protein